MLLFGLAPGLSLAGHRWVAATTLIAAILLFGLLCVMAARMALRVALLPLAFCWLMLGLLLSGIEPAPDPQKQLSVVADAGDTTGSQW